MSRKLLIAAETALFAIGTTAPAFADKDKKEEAKTEKQEKDKKDTTTGQTEKSEKTDKK